jgi:hypothetical protein
MTNTPLSSGEQGKLLIFGIFLTPTVIFIIGLIPIMIIAFSIYTLKSNNDFSHIETGAKYLKFYLWLTIICLTGFSLFGIYHDIYLSWRGSIYWEKLLAYLSLPLCAVFYFAITNTLFLKPLRAHREWVEVNDIFSSKPKR